MDKLTYKHEIIRKCREILQQKYLVHEAEMKEAQQAANEAGPPKDRYDPYRSQMLRKRNLLAEQCQQVLDMIEVLNRIEPVILEKVSFGSVVVTSQHKLFVAVSLGKIELNQEIIHVISVHTPLFEALKGRKSGENILFNQNKILITEVF